MGTKQYVAFFWIFSIYSGCFGSSIKTEFLYTLLDINATLYVDLVVLSEVANSGITVNGESKTSSKNTPPGAATFSWKDPKTSSEGRSFYVEAQEGASAVLYVRNSSSSIGEATFLIPLDNLDKEYRAVTYCEVYGFCQIGISSYLDNTEITVDLPPSVKTAKVFPSGQYQVRGQSISANLDKNSSLYIECDHCDLTGTKVTSNQKISVISGGKNVIVGFGNKQNAIFEQLPPVSKWGMEFAWTCFACGDQGSYVRIVPSQSPTTLKVSGHKTIVLNSVWRWFHFRLDKDTGVTITASKPVMTVVFVLNRKKNNDVLLSSMIVIPPVEQYAKKYSQYFPQKSETHVTYIGDNSEHNATIADSDVKFHPSELYAYYASRNQLPADAKAEKYTTRMTGMCMMTVTGDVSYSYCMSSYQEQAQNQATVSPPEINAYQSGSHFKIGIPPFMTEKTNILITLQGQNNQSLKMTSKPESTTCKFLQENTSTSLVVESVDTADCFGNATEVSGLLPLTLNFDTDEDATTIVSVIGNTKMATFLAIPSNALGQEYVALTYCTNGKLCTCTITAYVGNAGTPTNVKIMLPKLEGGHVSYNGVNYTSYHSFSVTLHESQSFLLTCACDLTGTFIKANQKIAVVCGGESNRGAFLEQIPPLISLNKEYVLPYGINNGKIKFVTSEANNIVKVRHQNGIELRYVLYNAGDYMQVSSSNFEKVISTKQILVVYILDELVKDGFMALGVSPEAFVNTHVFRSPSYNNRIVQLRSVKTPQVNVTEDGNAVTSVAVNSNSPTPHNLNNMTNLTTLHCRTEEGFAAFLFKLSDKEDAKSFGTALGRKIKSKTERCQISDNVINDTLDNDCDGLIDEEICVTKVEVYDCMQRPDVYIYDFDIDGRHSEDCGMEVPEPRRCKCKCNVMGDPSVANISAQQLANIMEATKKQLTKNKTSLSSFIRKKTSASDNRPAAVGVGSIGIVMLTLTFVALTLADAFAFIQYVVGWFR